jgi:type III pantothenate kinase
MNLIIDIGNSFTKVALCKNNEIQGLFVLKKLTLKLLREICEKQAELNAVIISSVAADAEKIRTYLQKKYLLIEYNSETEVPVTNNYKTPETLGSDRLAAACAGRFYFPGKNVLIIDAGTCIKYDLINVKGEYLGGAISPGIHMRFKAMNTFTEKLPLVVPRKTEQAPGNSTESSMLSGVMNGTLYEMEGMIAAYEKELQPLEVILSGGDMNYFAAQLKNRIFAVPNIVLIGLNEILKFNVDRQK